jgi:hypothetical protein
LSKAAIRKKRAPRVARAVARNSGKLKAAKPLMIVTSLNGIGVRPFTRMIAAPHSAYQRRNSSVPC